MSDGWPEILARISVPRLPDLDLAQETGPEPPAFPAAPEAAPRPPAGVLWAEPDGAKARFGVRVRRSGDDIRPLAARLAAAERERGIEPVIVSHVNRSGFEQFGFRVERVLAESGAETDAQEAEIARFWGLTIIVDLDEVPGLS